MSMTAPPALSRDRRAPSPHMGGSSTRWALLMVASLALAGCSGGGGDDDQQSPSPTGSTPTATMPGGQPTETLPAQTATQAQPTGTAADDTPTQGATPSAAGPTPTASDAPTATITPDTPFPPTATPDTPFPPTATQAPGTPTATQEPGTTDAPTPTTGQVTQPQPTATPGCTTEFYFDGDDDGFGLDSLSITACEPPQGYAAVGGDCDDNDDYSYPQATEVCDTVDNDCDAETDEDFYQGSGPEGTCGIRTMLPAHGTMAITDGYKIRVDFESNNPQSGSQPYAMPDNISIVVTGSDGSTQEDFGSPSALTSGIPTRLTWPVGLNVDPGVDYTLEITQCEVAGCGSGWVIKGRSNFTGALPCTLAFDTKPNLVMTKLGNTGNVSMALLNTGIEGNPIHLGLWFMGTSPDDTFPLNDVTVLAGPLTGTTSPFGIMADYGAMTVFRHATVTAGGQFSTPLGKYAVPVPVTDTEVTVLFVQDARLTGTLSTSGNITSLSSYRIEGIATKDDLHKMLVDFGQQSAESQIKYDVDLDGNGSNDAANMVMESDPQWMDTAGCPAL